MDMCLCYQVDFYSAACSWWWLGCMSKRMDMCLCNQVNAWICACVIKSTSSASYSWWWLGCTSKNTYGNVLVLSSRRLVRPAADDDLVLSFHFTSLYKSNIFKLTTSNFKPWKENVLAKLNEKITKWQKLSIK